MTSFTKLATDMERFFATKMTRDVENCSPNMKAAKANGDEDSAQRRKSVNVDDVGLSQSQAAWVSAGVGRALEAFGTEVDNRIAPLEAKASHQDVEILQLKARLALLETAVESSATVANTVAMDSKIDEIEKTVKDLSASAPFVAHHPPTVNVAARDPATNDTPYELRKYARIGNLGWDEAGNVLAKRAREVLGEANVPAETFDCVCGVRKEGSVVSLTFRGPEELRAARARIRELQKTLPGHKAPVWLDVEKTTAELRPARVIHRLAEVLKELDDASAEPKGITKIMNGKQIKDGEMHLLAWTFRSQVNWSTLAQSRWNENQLQIAKAFAED